MQKSSFGSIRRGRSGHYQVRVSIRGNQVGIGAFDTRREAVQALARHLQRHDDRSAVDRRVARQLLRDFAEQWWTTRTGYRPSTRVRDREALDRDVLPFFGNVALGRIEQSDVQEWVNQLAERLAPSSVRRTFVVFDQLLRYATARNILPVNPCGGAQLPRIARYEARFLTPHELEHLASAIDQRYRAMVLVMAWGTLRIGEAAGLRRSDIELDAGTIRIENNAVQVLGRPIEGPPKTRAGRRSMTLPQSVIAELRIHLDRQPGSRYVFGVSGERPLCADDWRTRPWYNAVCDSGLDPLRPHDLKHTGVALLALAGVDPSEIARRAGHSSVAFTYDRYGHLFPEIDKQAAEKLDLVRIRSRNSR